MANMQDQHSAIVQAFKLIDQSGDGHISQEELLAFCRENGSFLDHLQLGGVQARSGAGGTENDLDYKVEALLSLLDINSNGYIEVEELERALTGRLQDVEEARAGMESEDTKDELGDEEDLVAPSTKSRCVLSFLVCVGRGPSVHFRHLQDLNQARNSHLPLGMTPSTMTALNRSQRPKLI